MSQKYEPTSIRCSRSQDVHRHFEPFIINLYLRRPCMRFAQPWATLRSAANAPSAWRTLGLAAGPMS